MKVPVFYLFLHNLISEKAKNNIISKDDVRVLFSYLKIRKSLMNTLITEMVDYNLLEFSGRRGTNIKVLKHDSLKFWLK